jgi:hypothetical protein
MHADKQRSILLVTCAAIHTGDAYSSAELRGAQPVGLTVSHRMLRDHGGNAMKELKVGCCLLVRRAASDIDHVGSPAITA